LNLTEILFLSVALGIDCLIVSFTQGLIFVEKKKRYSLLLALTMGLFQGAMPLISYYPTGLVSDYLVKYSSFIVFTIFLILGLKFILEVFFDKDETPVCKIGLRCLILMGIATSIDALGAGVGLGLTETRIFLSVTLIGLMSFIMSLIGFWTGNKIEKIPSQHLKIFGGLILIGLAIKSLIN
jgi:putative Mn2+ efflux pump MntP